MVMVIKNKLLWASLLAAISLGARILILKNENFNNLYYLTLDFFMVV